MSRSACSCSCPTRVMRARIALTPIRKRDMYWTRDMLRRTCAPTTRNALKEKHRIQRKQRTQAKKCMCPKMCVNPTRLDDSAKNKFVWLLEENLEWGNARFGTKMFRERSFSCGLIVSRFSKEKLEIRTGCVEHFGTGNVCAAYAC